MSVRNAADSSPVKKNFSREEPDSLLNENELVGNGKATKVDNQRADSVKSRFITLTLCSSDLFLYVRVLLLFPWQILPFSIAI